MGAKDGPNGKGPNQMGVISFILGLVGGTGGSIITKILFTMQAEGINGEMKPFEKPMFLTFIMFCAMTCALPAHAISNFFQNDGKSKKTVSLKVLLWLFLPALFDLAGTNFAQIGLVHTTVSCFQLLRCSVIIVTAILKAFVLKHHLKGYMWAGVGINIVAVIIASLSSFLEPENADGTSASSHNPLLGFIFIMCSCIVQGSQYIFEEQVLDEHDVPPLIVIGMEGLWGTIMMLIIAPMLYYAPGSDSGSIENIPEAFYMIQNSSAIKWGVLVFFFTITMYNIFCIYVTAYLSAIWHAILDNFRPLTVWVVDLSIFYWFTKGTYGEGWTSTSWPQALGMVILFIGTAVYNGSIMIPGVDYKEGFIEGPVSPGMHVPDSLASSYIGHSPLLRQASLAMYTDTASRRHSGSSHTVLSPLMKNRAHHVNYSS
eukprot:39339_1